VGGGLAEGVTKRCESSEQIAQLTVSGLDDPGQRLKVGDEAANQLVEAATGCGLALSGGLLAAPAEASRWRGAVSLSRLSVLGAPWGHAERKVPYFAYDPQHRMAWNGGRVMG
jgi:hypothetical protein